MKTSLSILLASFTVLALSGCQSTQKTFGTDPIRLQSTTTYEFQEGDSFARNVAYMSGATKGMRDKDNFADAQLTISRGSVAFDTVAGLVQGGIVHSLGNLALGGSARGAIRQHPTYIVLMDDTRPADGDYSDDVLRLVEAEFGRVFAQIDGVNLVSVHLNHSEAVVIWNGSYCTSQLTSGSRPLLTSWAEAAGLPIDQQYCVMELTATIPWRYNDRLVVSLQQRSGRSMEEKIVRHGGIGYTFIPGTYVLDQYRTNTAFPFVLHDHRVHLFSTENLSFPLEQLDEIVSLVQQQ